MAPVTAESRSFGPKPMVLPLSSEIDFTLELPATSTWTWAAPIRASDRGFDRAVMQALQVLDRACGGLRQADQAGHATGCLVVAFGRARWIGDGTRERARQLVEPRAHAAAADAEIADVLRHRIVDAGETGGEEAEPAEPGAGDRGRAEPEQQTTPIQPQRRGAIKRASDQALEIDLLAGHNASSSSESALFARYNRDILRASKRAGRM